jgi:6-phosphogluconolactonase (cycloisomerase 2 family)
VNIRRIVRVAAVTAGVFWLSSVVPRDSGSGSAQLVSIQEFGELCPPEAMGASTGSIPGEDTNLFADFRDGSVYAAGQETGSTSEVTRPPVRSILDKDPIYASVGVDTRLNEVFLQDSNTWSIRVFNRLDNTPADAMRTEPKRVISGPKTDVQFNSCVWIDPVNGDIYSVENDIGDSIVVFSHDADGDIVPKRHLKITHRGFAMTVDEEKQELFLSVQYPPQVAVYRKEAEGDEKPKRLLQGESTRLSDAHGIAIDTKSKLMFVNNWGNISDYAVVGTGRFDLPSITIYPIDANGDTPPVRIIQGPKTQLNWPGAMALDAETGDLYVANDVGQSILVFHETDSGNVAPYRVIKGQKTRLSYPTGVFIDAKNKELWASNLGNSSATVYPLTANGDVAPLRTIRSAPANKVSLRFGKTQAVAYDSKREEILVPN